MDLRVAAPASAAAAARRGVLGARLPRAWPLRALGSRWCLSVRMSVATTEAATAAVGASEDAEMETRNARTVVAVILGGGAGTRLFPLTKRWAKPAVRCR